MRTTSPEIVLAQRTSQQLVDALAAEHMMAWRDDCAVGEAQTNGAKKHLLCESALVRVDDVVHFEGEIRRRRHGWGAGVAVFTR